MPAPAPARAARATSLKRLALIAALGAMLGAGGARAEPVLERVVMISRHGVRAPTASLEALSAQTGRAWPSFGVAPGELTPHGAKALSAMGQYLRQIYTRRGVLPQAGCPATGAVQIWADGADHRTRESGQLLAEALAPGCGLAAAHGRDGVADPMFSGSGSGVCPMAPQAALQAVQERTQGGQALVDGPSARAIATLQRLLGPQACAAAQAACLNGETTLQSGKGAPKLVGPLATTASVAENLSLAYEDDLPAENLGWAGDARATIAALMPAHERSSDLLRRTPYLAAHNGSVMARTLLDLLAGRAPSDSRGPPLQPGARLVMIAGHDTNLSNVAGVLGLNWTLPDQPDSTAPDTTLALELWRDPSTGSGDVRAVIYSQSLDQLRSASPLDDRSPAGFTEAVIGACQASGTTCALDVLAKAVRGRLPAECLN